MKGLLILVAVCFGQMSFGFSETWLDWECEAPVWTKRPSVTGGVFEGTIQATCVFGGGAGGTFADLEKSLLKEVIEKADKVHQGPDQTTFQGMPAVYLDATTTQTVDGMTATVRGDVYFATDSTKRFLTASTSKSIQASGMAQNLKAISGGFDVVPGKFAGEYRIVIVSSMKVQKPNMVPVNLFKQKVMEGAESHMKNDSQELLKRLGQVL